MRESVIVVALLSLAGDFLSSVVVSVVAVLCLVYLAPPNDSFLVSDPQDIVAIAAFFITSFVIIGLMYRMRRLADEALKRVRRQLVEVEELGRRRIAGDLYDDVCQRLTLVALQLQEPNHCDSIAFRDELRNEVSKIASDTQVLAHELVGACRDRKVLEIMEQRLVAAALKPPINFAEVFGVLDARLGYVKHKEPPLIRRR